MGTFVGFWTGVCVGTVVDGSVVNSSEGGFVGKSEGVFDGDFVSSVGGKTGEATTLISKSEIPHASLFSSELKPGFALKVIRKAEAPVCSICRLIVLRHANC